jgi:hypothetical protein
MSTETLTADQAVDEILAKQAGAVPITFTATYVGHVPKHADDAEWEHDAWSVSFRHPNKMIVFPFRTGIGLRAEPTNLARSMAKYEFPGLTRNDIATRTSYAKRYLAYLETLRKPKAPTAASVLHCLLSDAQARDMSFMDWASDYGYDTDSIKALGIYNECCEISKKLDTIFNRDLQDKLRDALQDY